MVMDEAELARRTSALVEVFAARIPESELRGLRSAGGGELLDLLISVMQQTGASVSTKELENLRTILVGWGVPAGRNGRAVTAGAAESAAYRCGRADSRNAQQAFRLLELF
jgi:hypothetical protein